MDNIKKLIALIKHKIGFGINCYTEHCMFNYVSKNICFLFGRISIIDGVCSELKRKVAKGLDK